jgi:hemerythrin-like domain-containing protein
MPTTYIKCREVLPEVEYAKPDSLIQYPSIFHFSTPTLKSKPLEQPKSLDMANAPWADKPFQLIATPDKVKGDENEHLSVWVAREMVNAHNGMLRGLNSIYQQAPHVSNPKDIQDFLTYCRFWTLWIHEHHEGEETMFFPAVEKITGEKGFMEKNVAQHKAFEGGFKRFEEWFTKAEQDIGSYDGMQARKILDEAGPVLTQHLTDEISTLLALKEYDGEQLKKAMDEFSQEMAKGDKVSLPSLMRRLACIWNTWLTMPQDILYPLVFGTLDKTFEGGNFWPEEVPFFVFPLVHYWYEKKHQGVWRFNPCTTYREKRPLMFGCLGTNRTQCKCMQ